MTRPSCAQFHSQHELVGRVRRRGGYPVYNHESIPMNSQPKSSDENRTSRNSIPKTPKNLGELPHTKAFQLDSSSASSADCAYMSRQLAAYNTRPPRSSVRSYISSCFTNPITSSRLRISGNTIGIELPGE